MNINIPRVGMCKVRRNGGGVTFRDNPSVGTRDALPTVYTHHRHVMHVGHLFGSGQAGEEKIAFFSPPWRILQRAHQHHVMIYMSYNMFWRMLCVHGAWRGRGGTTPLFHPNTHNYTRRNTIFVTHVERRVEWY
jgi:hypothetical protein